MKIIEDTLRVVSTLEHDPGEYPSGAASAPLRPQRAWEITGHVIFEYEESVTLTNAVDEAFKLEFEAPEEISELTWEVRLLPGRRLKLFVKDWR